MNHHAVEGLKKLITEDGRKSDRLKIPIKISYLVNPQGEWSPHFSVEDIGGNGFKFTSPLPLPSQTKLRVKVYFPEQSIPPLVAEAAVAWSKATAAGHTVGVEITQMAYEDRKKFVGYICEKIILKNLNPGIGQKE